MHYSSLTTARRAPTLGCVGSMLGLVAAFDHNFSVNCKGCSGDEIIVKTKPAVRTKYERLAFIEKLLNRSGQVIPYIR